MSTTQTESTTVPEPTTQAESTTVTEPTTHVVNNSKSCIQTKIDKNGFHYFTTIKYINIYWLYGQ
jgi:hypothetical protein